MRHVVEILLTSAIVARNDGLFVLRLNWLLGAKMRRVKKVVLVDQDEFTRYMMQEIATTLEIEVVIASTCDEVCDVVSADPEEFGLILVDLQLPKTVEAATTKDIRRPQNDPMRNIPIVAVTADLSEKTEQDFKNIGVDGVTSKPITPGQLLGLIDKYCVAA